MEAGAAIWFNQDISGKITVLLAPYKSDLVKVNEENIILLFGADPTDLTEAAIRNLFRTFIRYCAATSMMSTRNYSGYLFRLWLTVKDIRNRKIQRVAVFRVLEKLFVIALATAGVWATLFTSSKWPLL